MEDTQSKLDLEGQMEFELIEGRNRKDFMGKEQPEKRQW